MQFPGTSPDVVFAATTSTGTVEVAMEETVDEQDPGGTDTGSESADQNYSWRDTWLRPIVIAPIVIFLFAGLAAGAWLFQPWKLFVDDVVDEAAPTSQTTSPNPTSSAAAEPEPTPEVIAKGKFISHEHDTNGTVKVLELPDGDRVLRLENFETSNGPDLKVWLAAAPVIPGTDGWFVFDDDEHVDLGPLKGNIGNQNYKIPAKVDLDELSSVSIWCDRFSVSFGAAELSATT